jgi:hypothetical protein
VRAAEDRVAFDPRGERNRTVHNGPRPLRGVDNVRRRLVEYGVIVRFHPDADSFLFLRGHRNLSALKTLGRFFHAPAAAGAERKNSDVSARFSHCQ